MEGWAPEGAACAGGASALGERGSDHRSHPRRTQRGRPLLRDYWVFGDLDAELREAVQALGAVVKARPPSKLFHDPHVPGRRGGEGAGQVVLQVVRAEEDGEEAPLTGREGARLQWQVVTDAQLRAMICEYAVLVT